MFLWHRQLQTTLKLPEKDAQFNSVQNLSMCEFGNLVINALSSAAKNYVILLSKSTKARSVFMSSVMVCVVLKEEMICKKAPERGASITWVTIRPVEVSSLEWQRFVPIMIALMSSVCELLIICYQWVTKDGPELILQEKFSCRSMCLPIVKMWVSYFCVCIHPDSLDGQLWSAHWLSNLMEHIIVLIVYIVK